MKTACGGYPHRIGNITTVGGLRRVFLNAGKLFEKLSER